MDRALKLHDATLRGLLHEYSGYESATEGGVCMWVDGAGSGNNIWVVPPLPGPTDLHRSLGWQCRPTQPAFVVAKVMGRGRGRGTGAGSWTGSGSGPGVLVRNW